MFEYSAFKNAHQLEGGFNAWRIHNPAEKLVVHRPVGRFTVKANPSILSGIDLINSSKSKDARIFDVRSEGGYQGTEKREYCERYERIPGAIWFEWT